MPVMGVRYQMSLECGPISNAQECDPRSLPKLKQSRQKARAPSVMSRNPIESYVIGWARGRLWRHQWGRCTLCHSRPRRSFSIYVRVSSWETRSMMPGGEWLDLRVSSFDPASRMGGFVRIGRASTAPPAHNPYGVNFVSGGISLTRPGLVGFHLMGNVGGAQMSLDDRTRLRLALRVLPSDRLVEAFRFLTPKSAENTEGGGERTLAGWVVEPRSAGLVGRV